MCIYPNENIMNESLQRRTLMKRTLLAKTTTEVRANTRKEEHPGGVGSHFLVNYIIFFSEVMLNRKDFPVLAKKKKKESPEMMSVLSERTSGHDGRYQRNVLPWQ